MRIDSENPEAVVGEIQAKGVNLFSGYFKNERATKAAFTDDGWFNTGDLGLIDRKGNVYIKGRSKSMLLSSNGQNIYPEEIANEIKVEVNSKVPGYSRLFKVEIMSEPFQKTPKLTVKRFMYG